MTRILIVLLLTPLFAFLLGNSRVQEFLAGRRGAIRAAAVLVSVAMIVLVFLSGWIGVVTHKSAYHDEATVLSIAAAFEHGQAMYPAAGAPVEYGLLYGPATYLAYLPPILAGADYRAFYQVWVMLAVLGSVGLVYLALAPLVGTLNAVLACGFFSVLINLNSGLEMAIKADCWILLFHAMAFWAVNRLPRWPAMVCIAVCGAILVNLKFTLLFPALLPCIYLWERHRDRGLRPAMVSAVLIPPLALAPFCLPRISFVGYMTQLRDASHHGYALHLLLDNIYFLSFMFVPLLALFWLAHHVNRAEVLAWVEARKPLLLVLLLAAIVAGTTGSKRGAGGWHCMAVAVPAAMMLGELLPLALPGRPVDARGRALPLAAVLAIAVALILGSLRTLQEGTQQRLRRPSLAKAEDELHEIVREHPGTVLQMGYSDGAHYDFTFLRSMLIIDGSPLFIDGDARNEATLVNQEIPEGVIEDLEHCKVGIWIVPRGGEPFSMESLYYLGGDTRTRYLFSSRFRQAFFDSYHKVPSHYQYYDLWECSHPQA